MQGFSVPVFIFSIGLQLSAQTPVVPETQPWYYGYLGPVKEVSIVTNEIRPYFNEETVHPYSTTIFRFSTQGLTQSVITEKGVTTTTNYQYSNNRPVRAVSTVGNRTTGSIVFDYTDFPAKIIANHFDSANKLIQRRIITYFFEERPTTNRADEMKREYRYDGSNTHFYRVLSYLEGGFESGVAFGLKENIPRVVRLLDTNGSVREEIINIPSSMSDFATGFLIPIERAILGAVRDEHQRRSAGTRSGIVYYLWNLKALSGTGYVDEKGNFILQTTQGVSLGLQQGAYLRHDMKIEYY